MTGRAFFGMLVAAAAFGAEPVRLRPPLWTDRDDRDIPKPKVQKVSELYAIVYNSWFRHLSLDEAAVSARDKGALNINAWDEVPNSSWFTNRLGRRSLSLEEIVAGLPGVPPQPGRSTVERNLQVGYTPKLRIKDGAGNRYWVKFDLPHAPERNSSAERISTLILYAAGYNVPHNSVIRFRAEDLELAKDAQYTDELNRRRPMTADDLAAALGMLKPGPDERYRGIASFYLPGEDAGEFKYHGRRKDDPNDLIPHELRRELRGLRVIAAWINHADTGDKNTKDMFISRDGKRGYVRHHLLDFGSTLGSGDYTNGPYRVGHEYLFDGSAIANTFFSMGAWRRPWEARGRILHPEVGYYGADLFDPERWRPNYPNLAFARMDLGDAYWGARIVTAFSNSLIDRIVESGEYSRPEVTRYVAETLKQRRDTIGRWYLDMVTPLEEISYSNGRVRFRDLAVDRGYAEAASRRYQNWVEDLKGKRSSAPQVCGGEGCAVASSWGPGSKPDRYGRVPEARVMIQSARRDGGWAAPIGVILGRTGSGGDVGVLGWQHAPR